jgi:site-specific DNA-methyltransferase (adenine-specific)
METNIIHLQDCVEGMKALPANSIDICVTSPPYNLGIEYGTYRDNKPRQDYLDWLGTVFDAVKHCLKDDGHFWLNVGYSNADPWVAMDVAQIARNHFVLQNSIMWVKSIYVNGKTSGHFKPINSKRYISPTWEHFFHFTKLGNVEMDRLAVGVPYEWFEANLRNPKTAATKPNLRCKGNTWFIPYDTISNKAKHRGNHPATYPVALVEDAIKVSGITSGVLLDPFMGSGTSAIASLNCGLEYIGFDIDNNYKEFAEDRIADRQAQLTTANLFINS